MLAAASLVQLEMLTSAAAPRRSPWVARRVRCQTQEVRHSFQDKQAAVRTIAS